MTMTSIAYCRFQYRSQPPPRTCESHIPTQTPRKLKVATANSRGCCYPSGSTRGSNVSPAPYTRKSGWQGGTLNEGQRGSQRRNSLLPKSPRRPRRKNFSSPRRETPALLLFPGDISSPVWPCATFRVHRCPFWPIRVFSHLQILASMVWVPTSATRRGSPRRVG